MSPDDHHDPGADTAMFQAFVEEGHGPPAAPSVAGRWAVVAVAVAVVVVLLAILVALV
jgi:hypothetical protein